MLKVYDKFDQKEISTLEYDSWSKVNTLIGGLSENFDIYRYSSIDTRLDILIQLSKTLLENKDELVKIIVQEAGKPKFYAEQELERCIRTVQIGIDYIKSDCLIEKLDIDFNGTNHKSGQTKRFSKGIVFGIVPFNFPLNLALHKIVPSIITGSPILIKPSPYTPLSLKLLIDKTNETLEHNWVNFINVENDVADNICSHNDIHFISFTGSDQIGWKIKNSHPNKEFTLELGGNAACIIEDVSDIEAAAKQCAIGSFLYAGQICISTQRIIINDSLYDAFKSALILATKNIVSGNPNDNATNSSLIDKVYLDRIDTWVHEAVNQGAILLCGGKKHSIKNNIYEPTILEHVHSKSTIYTEEVFGPVVILEKYSDFNDAINLVNDSKYGLQCGVFTDDQEKRNLAFDRLEVGGVIFNNVPGFRRDEMPYGGIKDSGMGKEGIQYAVEEMSYLKLRID